MAMGLMRAKVAQSVDDWRIESAGVWAEEGHPAAFYTRRVLEARDIGIIEHSSRPVTAEMVREFDLILVMERNHKEALRAAFPGLSDRIYMMSEMVGRQEDIVDPIGGPKADYEDTAREMEEILSEGFDNILRLTGNLVV
jgi:protein-tyrosine phosphatase